MEKFVLKGLENQGERKFDKQLCIEVTLRGVTPDLYDYIGDRISLAKKFLPDEILPSVQVGSFQLKTVNEKFDELKANFLIRSGNQEQTISEFGTKVLEEAAMRNLDQDVDITQLSELVNEVSIQQISADLSSGFGSLKSRGYQVYPNKNDEAVLVVLGERDSIFRVVNLDILNEENPEFVKTEVSKLFLAQAEGKLENNVTYNLAMHNINEDELVPDFISELANLDEKDLMGVQNFLALVAQNEDEGSQRVYNFISSLQRRFINIPDDGRTIPLDSHLSHLSICPSESAEVRAVSRDRLNTISQIRVTDYSRSHSQTILEGQEVFRNPILHTPDFIDDAIAIENETSKKDHDFLKLINQTLGKLRGIESTQKELKRRMPKVHQLIERFKVALGDSSLDGSNFDEFIKDAVSKFSMELGSSLSNYGIKSLDEAEKVISQSLYTKAYKITGKNEWIWKEDRHDPYRPQVNIKDEQLRDVLLYVAVKTVQQKATNASTRAGANQALNWIKDKYTVKVGNSDKKLKEYDLRKKYSRKLMHQLGISKYQITRLVNHVKQDKMGKFQSYDYSKFGILFRTLIYSKQGLVDLDSKAFKSVLTALYPSITADEWKMLL